MKSLAKLVVVAVTLVASNVIAHAQITGGVSFGGSNTFSSNEVLFSGDANLNPASATGTFADLYPGTPAASNFTDFNFTPNGTLTFGPDELLFQISGNGNTIYFTGGTVTDTTFTVGTVTYENITVSGDYSQVGADPLSATAGTFGIDTQMDSQSGTTSTTYSASAGVAPTPEPSSLLLLGTGLLGAAGALYRRGRLISAV